MRRARISTTVRALVGVMTVTTASTFALASTSVVSAAGSVIFLNPAVIVASPGRMWVGNSSGNSITEINSANGELVRYVTTRAEKSLRSDAMVVSGSHLWATAKYSIGEFNLSDGSLVRVIDKTADEINSPDEIAVQGSHVWVLNSQTAPHLIELNESNGSLVKVVLVPNAHAFVVSGRHLWTANPLPASHSTITEFKTSGGSVVRTIKAPVLGLKSATALVTSGNRLWVTSGDSNEIAELNTETGKLIRRIKLPFAGLVASTTLIASGSHLFMSTFSVHGVVFEVNQSDGAVVRVFKTPASQDYQGSSAIAVAGNTLWVGSRKFGIDEFDVTTGALIRNIQ
jgi:outer membrane protein assembly factor BamB